MTQLREKELHHDVLYNTSMNFDSYHIIEWMDNGSRCVFQKRAASLLRVFGKHISIHYPFIRL